MLGRTEPLLVTALAAFVYLAVRAPGGAAEAIAFFLLPSLKHAFVAPVLLYLAAARTRLPALAAGMAVAAATVVPFLLWDWRSTIAGMTTQMIAPTGPRLDSDSLVALMGAKTGIIVSRWVSARSSCWWRRSRGRGFAGTASAACSSRLRSRCVRLSSVAGKPSSTTTTSSAPCSSPRPSPLFFVFTGLGSN